MAKYKQLEITEMKKQTYMVEIEAKNNKEMKMIMEEIESGTHPTSFGTVYNEEGEQLIYNFEYEVVGESDESII